MPRKPPGTKQPVRKGNHHVIAPNVQIACDGGRLTIPCPILILHLDTSNPSLARSFIRACEALGVNLRILEEWGTERVSRRGIAPASAVKASVQVIGLAEHLEEIANHPAVLRDERAMSASPPIMGAGATKAK